MTDVHLVVCVNERLGPGKKSCAGSGSRELIPLIKQEILAQGLDLPVVEQVCLGRCMEGIALRIAPGGAFFTEVEEPDIKHIVRQLGEFQASRQADA